MVSVNQLNSDFKSIERAMMEDGGIYKATINYIEASFNEREIKAENRLQIISQMMTNMSISLTSAALNASLQLQQIGINESLQSRQIAAQERLANAEEGFNKARSELIKAQVATENKKALAVARETASMDDNLRVKEAEILSNAVFGYAAGGMDVPGNLQTKMLDAINAVTP